MVSATVKHVTYKERSWAVLHSVEGCSYVDSSARLMYRAAVYPEGEDRRLGFEIRIKVPGCP